MSGDLDLAAAAQAVSALSSAAAGLPSGDPGVDDDSPLSISLTPLYGTEALEPVCSLLRIDHFNILLDLGWDHRFQTSDLEILKPIVPDIDAVLISHADLSHMGGLPYAVAKLGLRAKIYVTLPVWKMGQMVLYDAVQAMSRYNFTCFSLDDIDTAFEQIIPVKYSQEIKLSDDRGETITVTPFSAGHSLGGSIWRIVRETEEILYAVDFNHRREAHLMGTVLEQFTRPSALITDSLNVLREEQPRRLRDKAFFSQIFETLKHGGNVLLPIDTAGRVLELLLLMNRAWEETKLAQLHNLVFLSHEASQTVAFARSLIEWMSEKIQKQFDSTKSNPLSFPDMHLCQSWTEFAKLPRVPFVCFATDACMESGLAREIFLKQIAGNPKDLVLFTQRPPKWSFSHALLQCRSADGDGRLTFRHKRNVPLEGKELEEHMKQLARQRERSSLHDKAGLAMLDDPEDDDEMMMDEEDMIVGGMGRARAAPKYPMFPFQERRTIWTVYGEPLGKEELDILQGSTGGHENEVSTGGSGGDRRRRKDGMDVVMEKDGMKTFQDNERTQDIPHKTIQETLTISVACRVGYVDLEGRSDGRSIKTILSKIRPRKLILLRGSSEAKETLKSFCLEKGISKEVSVPAANQLVDITSEGNMIRINLQDAFLRDLDWKTVGDYEVAFAEGTLRIDYKESTLPILGAKSEHLRGRQQPVHFVLSTQEEEMETDDEENEDGGGVQPKDEAAEEGTMLGVVVEKEEVPKTGHPAVFIGDLKFNQLKRVLNQQGIPADFIGGVLVCCGGLVNIRKVSGTKFSLQGGLSPEYFQIRELLYGEFSIV